MRSPSLRGEMITILLVPEGRKGVRQFRIPCLLIVIPLLLLVSCGTYLGSLLIDCYDLKSRMPWLAHVEKEREMNRMQIAFLEKRICSMVQRVEELRELDQKLKVMVNLEGREKSHPFIGVGGSSPLPILPQPTVTGPPDEKTFLSMHDMLDALDNEISICMRNKNVLSAYLENQRLHLAATPSIWPVRGWMSSTFGYRISPFTGEREFHKGIDISAPKNNPVVTPADGIILFAGSEPGYGKTMTVMHGREFVTRYAHLENILARKGNRVSRGDKIALVGSSGRSTGPHLHYEVIRNGVHVNPLHYIID